MSKHTPGPWTAIPDTQDGSRENWYVLTDKEDALSLGLSEPDAHLIAAAPDLLAALKEIVAGISVGTNPDHPWIKEARAAIAKAEARSS